MELNNQTSEQLKRKAFHAKVISVIIFVLGLFTFLGVDAYQDFYFDIKAQVTGIPIEYTEFSEFCGATRGKFPWESDFEYGMRAFWNMLSTMMAMSVIIVIAMSSLFAIIVGLFKLFNRFD